MLNSHLHFDALFCPGERPSDAQLVSPALCLAETWCGLGPRAECLAGPGPVRGRLYQQGPAGFLVGAGVQPGAGVGVTRLYSCTHTAPTNYEGLQFSDM